jgi:hypothetical protein
LMKLYTETTFSITKTSYESRIKFNLREVSIDDKLASSTSLSLQFKLSLSYHLFFFFLKKKRKKGH